MLGEGCRKDSRAVFIEKPRYLRYKFVTQNAQYILFAYLLAPRLRKGVKMKADVKESRKAPKWQNVGNFADAMKKCNLAVLTIFLTSVVLPTVILLHVGAKPMW